MTFANARNLCSQVGFDCGRAICVAEDDVVFVGADKQRHARCTIALCSLLWLTNLGFGSEVILHLHHLSTGQDTIPGDDFGKGPVGMLLSGSIVDSNQTMSTNSHKVGSPLHTIQEDVILLIGGAKSYPTPSSIQSFFVPDPLPSIEDAARHAVGMAVPPLLCPEDFSLCNARVGAQGANRVGAGEDVAKAEAGLAVAIDVFHLSPIVPHARAHKPVVHFRLEGSHRALPSWTCVLAPEPGC
mmetsp:Transcript_72751/g.160621  ORF Transcript_72751/g.160621 Transcript_72751/m.160621 type:complete len:242 (-) Transcript_72751:591-1316(-)